MLVVLPELKEIMVHKVEQEHKGLSEHKEIMEHKGL